MQGCVHRVLVVLVLLGIAASLLPRLFHEKKPATNSEAYRAAHGIAEGRANELRVKGVLLRFPPQYRPNPYTSGEIVRGRADRVSVDLDLGAWFDPRPLAHSHYLALVEIEIDRNRVEYAEGQRRQLAADWKSIGERADLGLREYVRARDDGGWGYRTYVPIDPGMRTPKGGLLIYDCAGRPGKEPERCGTRYQHPRGPYVEYYLSSMLLPRWREVHAEVLRTVDSFIVHEGNK
jgi:hypothetical protein